MSKIPASQVRVYLDEYDLSGFLNSSSQEIEQETTLVNGLDTTGPRRVVGNYDVKHSDMGFFDWADNSYDEIVDAAWRDGDDHYLGKTFGTSEGSTVYESTVKLTSHPMSGAVGDAVVRSFDSAGNNEVARGVVLYSATIGQPGAGIDGTGQNLGVKGSGSTYVVVFRVLALAGANITIVVQESSDNGSGDAYASVAGLTSGELTAIGVVRVTTTAALEAWRRVRITGTLTSATILVTAGIVAGS